MDTNSIRHMINDIFNFRMKFGIWCPKNMTVRSNELGESVENFYRYV